MFESPSYGTLTALPDGTVEFTVDDRLVRTWTNEGTCAHTIPLLQRCLIELTRDGWRPISHLGGEGDTSIVLSRFPYAAGAKLPTHGTLRFTDDHALILTVGGATMRRWVSAGADDDVFERAVAELVDSGWRVLRRHGVGATLVRG